eukprot:6958813-Heterocapsa_arctica.AAC.1
MINGQRKTRADAEFRRCVKDNLLYRSRWDWKLTPEQRTKRARDGCSRWYPGQHFPPWKYATGGVKDTGEAGFRAELIKKEGSIGKTKLSKALM